jgi:hypothetical protein
MDVIDPRAVVHTPDLVGVPPPDEPVEEGVASPATIRDSGEACILPRDADAAMAHHEHEEPRLAPVVITIAIAGAAATSTTRRL